MYPFRRAGGAAGAGALPHLQFADACLVNGVEEHAARGRPGDGQVPHQLDQHLAVRRSTVTRLSHYISSQRVFTWSGGMWGRRRCCSRESGTAFTSSSIYWSREVMADLQQQFTRALNQENPKSSTSHAHTGGSNSISGSVLTVQLNSQLFSLSKLHRIKPLKSCPEATTCL